MGDQSTNALVAILLGAALAVLLLIPTAAVQYRLDGRLGPKDLLVLGTSSVYALAMWTYTLLPLPATGSYVCQGSQLRVLGSFGLIHVPQHGGLLGLLREPAFLQIVLNVVLFVPLGYFLRVILKRGVVTATIVGFLFSLLIETTQRTGVWHLYPCAYRLFDVDDLIVNTLGAVVGSLLSILVVRRRRPDVVLPTTITFGRRLVGMVCDALFIVLTGATLAVGFRALSSVVLDEPVDRAVQNLLQFGVPFAVEAVLVVGFGRTVGELVVSLHTTARRFVVPARLVKLATGIAPLFLYAVPVVGLPLLVVFLVVTVLAAWRTREHRGLSHTLAGLELRIGDELT